MTRGVETPLVEAQDRTLSLFLIVAILMLIGIGALVLYSIHLGPLVGPGVEESFGLALALMFLMGAVLFHIADRVYRTWPLGRRIRAEAPEPIGESQLVAALKVLVLVAALAGIGYLIAILLAG